MSEPKVIVIGAGAAGLSSAYELKKKGIPVLILEAGSRAGGRMASETINDCYVETGAQLFSTADTVAYKLAEELNVHFGRSPDSILATIHNSQKQKTGVLNLAGILNFDNLRTFLVSGVFSPKGIAQFYQFVRFMRKRKSDFRSISYSRLSDLDVDESFAEWCRETIGDEFLEEFCRFAIACITLTTPERISTLNGMMMLWLAFFETKHTLKMPERGMGHFSQKLAQACMDITHLSTPVERVVVEDGQIRGVVTRNGLLESDAVICTTPASVAANILSDLPDDVHEFLMSIRYNQCCHVVIGIDRHPLPQGHYFYMLQRKGASILDCFLDSTVGSPFAAPEGIGLIHAYPSEEASQELLRLDDDEVKKRVIDEICRFAPAMPKDPIFTRVYRWEDAIVLPYGGMMRRLEALRSQGFPNVRGLYLAGDYLELVANVNSALKSGLLAAEAVSDYLRISSN